MAHLPEPIGGAGGKRAAPRSDLEHQTRTARAGRAPPTAASPALGQAAHSGAQHAHLTGSV